MHTRPDFRFILRHRAAYGFAAAVALLMLSPMRTFAADKPPTISVGLDAYRDWHRWPYLRIGQRSYMRSTYDRRGSNEGADASHFLYQLADDMNVTLDVKGPGVLVFKRTNHWHGSPWHYIVDGRDYIVKETSTADPENPTPNSVFIPEAQFPNPLTWTWSITKGADLMWVPIPFEESFTLAYGRTRYGTGYYIYNQFLPGIDYLSTPIKSWDMDIPPDDVLELLRQAGTAKILQKPFNRSGHDLRSQISKIEISKDGSKTISLDGPRMIRGIMLSAPKDQAIDFGECRMRITWDDREQPSVDAPINLLFGAGTLYNRDDAEYLVKAFPVNIRFDDDKVHLSMYFPMPFFEKANIEFENTADKASDFEVEVLTEPLDAKPGEVGYFHASYIDHGRNPEPGRDLVFLDTTKVEGGGDWAGHFVGTSFIFTHKCVLTTLEGDPRFYFDDSQTPQAYGTGSEEWGGGGDYWGGRTMSLPLAGHPVGAKNLNEVKNELDLIHSEYRYLLADCFPFGKNAKITFEHGGDNESKEHYKSITYWYGINKPVLVRTDELNVGDPQSEKAHAYQSPEGSEVQTLSSRYEWGVDHFEGREMFPATKDIGRYTKTSSTFDLKVDPDNVGVMLRRKFDYSFPNQCAKVYLSAPQSDGNAKEHYVGLWYTAGSNTCVYSNPKGELGATVHEAQTSNRQWREDEFLLPPAFTRGKNAIRVRVEFVPQNIPLFPGHPMADQAWSEYRYWAYSYVMP